MFRVFGHRHQHTDPLIFANMSGLGAAPPWPAKAPSRRAPSQAACRCGRIHRARLKTRQATFRKLLRRDDRLDVVEAVRSPLFHRTPPDAIH
jgi:hypothetical protein